MFCVFMLFKLYNINLYTFNFYIFYKSVPFKLSFLTIYMLYNFVLCLYYIQSPINIAGLSFAFCFDPGI